MEGNANGPDPVGLAELLEALAKQRLLAGAAKDRAKDAQKALDETLQAADLKAAKAEAAAHEEAAADLERKVREQAMALAKATQNRKPVEGVEIVSRTVFVITDQAAVEGWARVNAPMAFTLNADILGRVVKSLPAEARAAIPGASVDEQMYGSVRISGKLDELYLKA